MAPIRVLIVDDSVLIREVLGEALRSDPAIEIAAAVSSGEQALPLIAQLRPSLVMLDQGLPGISGSATLVEIRKINARLPVILFSPFSQSGQLVTDVFDCGTTQYLTKPNQRGSRRLVRERFRNELIPKIKALCAASPAPLHWAVTESQAQLAAPPAAAIEIVAIGASTGGPQALAELVAQFPADFPVPILIVQHMPATFTKFLAERLDSLAQLDVLEGAAGKRLGPGQIWIAPGDYHMTVVRQGNHVVLATNQRPTEQGCRPSVDVLFRSLAETFAARVLAVVLTGMGADGMLGSQVIRQAGGEVIAQDEATSAIWGMPGRVVAAGLAHRVYPLGQIASEIVRRVYASRESARLALSAAAK